MKYSNEMHMQKIRGKICKKSLMTTYLYEPQSFKNYFIFFFFIFTKRTRLFKFHRKNMAATISFFVDEDDRPPQKIIWL